MSGTETITQLDLTQGNLLFQVQSSEKTPKKNADMGQIVPEEQEKGFLDTIATRQYIDLTQ